MAPRAISTGADKGDVETLTVREFRELSGWRRFCYRLFRHPLVILGLGPIFVFVFRHRLPEHPLRANAQAWRDVMATNLAIAVALTVTAVPDRRA